MLLRLPENPFSPSPPHHSSPWPPFSIDFEKQVLAAAGSCENARKAKREEKREDSREERKQKRIGEERRE